MRGNDNELSKPKTWFFLAGVSALFLVYFGFEYCCGDFLSGKLHDAKSNSKDLYEYGLYSLADSSTKSDMEKDKEYALYALMATGLFLGIGFYCKNNE